MNQLRIAVAGAGLIGRAHIKLIRSSKECELAAIADPATGSALYAESLGVPLSTVSITTYIDTDLTTDNSGSFGSIQTNTGGRGMYEAGQDARRQILDWGAKKLIDDAKKANQTLDIKAEDLDLKDGKVFAKSDPTKTAALKVDGKKQTWLAVGRVLSTERTIKAVDGAKITLDVPVADSFDA